MDFALSDEQQAVRDLASRILADRATSERVAEVEATGQGVDHVLWQHLADAGLLGIALPADLGGAGRGPVELSLVLEEQGRRVAPVPLWSAAVGAVAVAELGSDGQRDAWVPAAALGRVRLTVALEEFAPADPEGPATTGVEEGGGWRLAGTKAAVPAVHGAGGVVVTASTAAGPAVFLLDPAAPGVRLEPVATTAPEPAANVVLEGAPAHLLGLPGDGGVARVLTWARVALASLQLGVAEGALRLAADHLAEREQFGRPLATFQAVAHQLADGSIATRAMRVTAWQAAWRLAAGLEAGQAALVAAWWAGDAGQQVVHTVVHLHGGLGVDTDHPVHRYLLWGKQIALTLGGPSADLSRLGDVLAGGGPGSSPPAQA